MALIKYDEGMRVSVRVQTLSTRKINIELACWKRKIQKFGILIEEEKHRNGKFGPI